MRLSHLCAIPLIAASLTACNGGMMTSESESSTGSTSQTSLTTSPSTTSPTTGPVLLCVPGEIDCNDDSSAVRVCNADGQGWEETPCGVYQSCIVNECLGPCELVADPPSSEGCSFWSNRMRHYQEDEVDALIVGNISNAMPATVQLYHIPNGKRKEEPVGDPVVVDPGKTYLFQLDNTFIGGFSQYRTGGTYRVVADLPVIAYQHSPLDNVATNDSSMLLPDHTLGDIYVIASYPAFGEPSYFNVVANEDETVVQWTPKIDTAGNNLPIPFVKAGETGMITMNRGDTLQIGASAVIGTAGCMAEKDACMDAPDVCEEVYQDCERKTRDVSGTVVTADKPIWVVGATNCAFVPFESGFCDHLQEVMIPLKYWGKEYIGAHSPVRLDEKHYWRIYAGEDGVSVTTDPPLPGTPINLAKRGDFQDLVVDNGVSVVFKSQKPFLPVQYLAGAQTGPGFGDPAMYQMVPVEQFLDRYAFVTGVNYALNYAQIIHKKGDADVLIDGVVVTGYYDVGDYEVADWLIEEGAHEAVSAKPFGLISIGYTIPNNCMPAIVDPDCDTDGHPRCCTACVGSKTDPECSTDGHPVCCTGPYASYAYPGGMRLKQIYNP